MSEHCNMCGHVVVRDSGKRDGCRHLQMMSGSSTDHCTN